MARGERAWMRGYLVHAGSAVRSRHLHPDHQQSYSRDGGSIPNACEALVSALWREWQPYHRFMFIGRTGRWEAGDDTSGESACDEPTMNSSMLCDIGLQYFVYQF